MLQKKDQYRQRIIAIRAGFVAQGSSLHAWCVENKVDTSNVRKAIAGQWSGPKADALVKRIEEAAGIEK